MIATIYENIGSGALDIDPKNDNRWVKLGKRLTRILLLSAFAFEVLSIFVTTTTSTATTLASILVICWVLTGGDVLGVHWVGFFSARARFSTLVYVVSLLMIPVLRGAIWSIVPA